MHRTGHQPPAAVGQDGPISSVFGRCHVAMLTAQDPSRATGAQQPPRVPREHPSCFTFSDPFSIALDIRALMCLQLLAAWSLPRGQRAAHKRGSFRMCQHSRQANRAGAEQPRHLLTPRGVTPLPEKLSCFPPSQTSPCYPGRWGARTHLGAAGLR